MPHPPYPGMKTLILFAIMGLFNWLSHVNHAQVNLWMATFVALGGLINYGYKFRLWLLNEIRMHKKRKKQ